MATEFLPHEKGQLVRARGPPTGLRRYGYAQYVRQAMPNASLIGFTGTPIEAVDVKTPAIFGRYIDI